MSIMGLEKSWNLIMKKPGTVLNTYNQLAALTHVKEHDQSKVMLSAIKLQLVM